MRYCLGVDIGNSAVTAAVADSSGVETVGLGRQSPRMPALVHVTPDGTILTGDDAVRATDLEPTWTARLLCRRLDNPAPIQLGERTCEVTDLLSTVLWDVLDRVTTLRGAAARARRADPSRRAGATRTGPAGGGRGQGRPTGRDDDHGPTRLRHLVRRSRPPRRGRFAVYDFGGGAVETAVLRADAEGVELVGPPDGVPHLGGVELDELVREHLDTRLGGALSRWDPRSREGARTRDRVLAACATAKETLSTDGVAEVVLRLPSGTRRILLHREEIDALFRRPVADTVAALRRVLDAAGERPGVLVLTGGSARIPLVTALIREAIGPGVRIEHAPEGAVAWGAAQLASKRAGAGTPGPAPVRPLAVPTPAGPLSDQKGSDQPGPGQREPDQRESDQRGPDQQAPELRGAEPSRGGSVRTTIVRARVAGPLARPRARGHAGLAVCGAVRARGRAPRGRGACPFVRAHQPAAPACRVHASAGPGGRPAPHAPRPRPGPSPARPGSPPDAAARSGSASPARPRPVAEPRDGAPPARPRPSVAPQDGAPPARPGPGAPAAPRPNPEASPRRPAPEAVTEFVPSPSSSPSSRSPASR